MLKHKKLTIAFIVIATVYLAAVSFAHKNYVVPILMYHTVYPQAPAENRLAVSSVAFERQLAFLKKHQYNVVLLESLIPFIKEKKRIPPKTVALTFDDGYIECYLYAFPIIKKYNLPVTVFVIVNEIGRPDRLSWERIKEMQDSGLVVFGSHALGPDPLTKINSEAELKRQIFDSKKILEERLARTVNTFSYPEGRFNEKIRQLAIEAGYKLAVATSPGKKYPNDDLFLLKRLRISSSSDNLFVFWIETSGLYTFIKEHRDKH